ncbi:N-acetylneuraminate epimerase [Agrobacterium tumefaciens]|uniref:N-acetylneuraminate epimerase n=1 Tax=Agrobacterium tumefaciens TaxID=358 RepID=UPI0021D342BD|nr:N-acetylneuraminate epimerase [Agrobacterium tumefaciens]UXS04678.1 YjhT family mutarotase [Agrobacterium tumefaciens]
MRAVLPDTKSAPKEAPQLTASHTSGKWPDLPVAIKGGIGVQFDDVAYVGLGSAGRDLYSLDLKNPEAGWKGRTAFPGAPTNGAAAAASGGRIFVFSGNGKQRPDAKSAIIFDCVHIYDPADDSWSRVETRTPVGLSGAKALSLSNGRIAIVGGYNKQLFDRYLADLSVLDKDANPLEFDRLVRSYMSMAPDEYRWNGDVLSYDPKTNCWGLLGQNPFPPNCDSAAVTIGQDDFVLVSGEVKPGLRTAAVKSVCFKENLCDWRQLTDLPKPASDEVQEGLGGAFAGYVGKQILVAGGVNFKGARANADAGNWYAHEGLTKIWRDEIYAFDGKDWREVGKLPRGLAYGISFSVPDGLLIVGGEDCTGNARAEVFVVNV